MNKEEFEKIKPLRNNCLCMRESKQTYGMLYVPDSFKDRSPYVLVHEAGPTAHPALRKGVVGIMSAHAKEKKDYFKVGSRKVFFTPDDSIQAVAYNNNIFPLGDRVLVKRRRDLHPDFLSGGELETPEQWTMEQGLYCEIVKFGLPKKADPRTMGLKIGDLCKLKNWEFSMFEIQIGDDYCLIVDIDDLILRTDG